MPITIANVTESTTLVITILLVIFFLSFQKSKHTDLFPIPVTSELKGLGILTVVFSHISYMLVTNKHFLYPLTNSAGVGVDLFLFMSGYGLTVGMLKKPLSVIEFYKHRLIRVFIPFWLVLIILFVADTVFLNIHYSPSYILRSMLGWFPTAYGFGDINSPLWYITWLLMFYALFPWVFNAARPWQTALILAVIANAVAAFNPLGLQAGWLHSLHTDAFSLGIVFAWLLHENKQQPNHLLEKLLCLRNDDHGIKRYVIIALMTVFAGYMTTHANSGDWPIMASILKSVGFNEGNFIGQATSLLTMLGLIIVFSMKKLDNKFLYIFGVYSYETYLIHWPLMSRYDVFFDMFPAWLAVLSWLLTFLGIGWLLQKITPALGVWIDRKW